MSITYNLDSYKAPKIRKKAAILNFGPSGNGKTRSLITLLRLGIKPIWINDFDEGAEPFLRLAVKEPNIHPDDVRIFTYHVQSRRLDQNLKASGTQADKDEYMKFCDDINKLFNHVDYATDNWKPGLLEERKVPAAIVIDSASALQDLLISAAFFDENAYTGKAGTDARMYFGRAMRKTVEIVRSLKSLPCITIWNAHEDLYKIEASGEMRIDPGFTGKLAREIAADFDVVMYSQKKTDKYTWLLTPDGWIRSAKTRFSEGLKEVEQDYAKIL